MRLLVVEDEEPLAEAVAVGLRRDGYAVDVALTGAAAGELLATTAYDLVSLDLALPQDGPSGTELCQMIRDGQLGDASTRVLMVTAHDSVGDRVAGLDAGADDYLVKPFALDEMRARIRSLLRRPPAGGTSEITAGPLTIDTATMQCTWNDIDVHLGPKEFAVLRYLVLRPGVVVSHETLLEHVWDRNADPFTETVRVTVGKLRRKLAYVTSIPPIETVPGCGYRFRPQG